MGRRAVIIVGLMLAVLAPAQAHAVGVWDRNDARGPYDLRWVGATHTGAGRIKLTVTFYPGFDAGLLPRRGYRPGVWVKLDDVAMSGFFRLNTRDEVVFAYGDTASSCCRIYPVAQPSPRTLVVRYHPIDEGEPGFTIHGRSVWGSGERRQPDWTRWFDLGPV
jgi:hypothetical protein